MDVTGPEEIFDLSEAAVDDLPFGLIAVSSDATIEQYNAYESRMARMPKDRVLGHNPVAALYTADSYYRKLGA